MKDPFLLLTRPSWGLSRDLRSSETRGVSSGVRPAPGSLPSESGAGTHAERAHSKFSASASERWFQCPGSVELSEGLPDKSSVWAKEGTHAHEVLEAIMRTTLSGNDGADVEEWLPVIRDAPTDMVRYGREAAEFIFGVADRYPGSEVLVETRIYLDFIHPEMFGTFDGAVVDLFGTLHVFDYKYGAGHFVSPAENLQMIFYGIGLAHRYHWNFKKIRLWIIQPRVRGYDGPLFWHLPTREMMKYVDTFRTAVERVEKSPEFREGQWCHWCRAKSVCPLKREKKLDYAKSVFGVLE